MYIYIYVYIHIYIYICNVNSVCVTSQLEDHELRISSTLLGQAISTCRHLSGSWSLDICGIGSIPINTIFSGMNIHLPAILMFTRGTRFWHTAMWDRQWNTIWYTVIYLNRFWYVLIYFDGLLEIWIILDNHITNWKIGHLENCIIGWDMALPTSQRPGKETLLWRVAGQLHLGTRNLFCSSPLHHQTHAHRYVYNTISRYIVLKCSIYIYIRGYILTYGGYYHGCIHFFHPQLLMQVVYLPAGRRNFEHGFWPCCPLVLLEDGGCNH